MISGGHTVLYCADVAKSVRFYIETLGMKLVEDLGPGLAIIDAGDGFRIALHMREANTSAPGATLKTGVGFQVRGDFETAVTVYANRGIVFADRSSARAKLAYFTDPDGNELHLWKLNR
jgi:catechol 2,3-dioxygenase-like lactoylglutathione lyase family enzyme